jgi:hypothetical protein
MKKKEWLAQPVRAKEGMTFNLDLVSKVKTWEEDKGRKSILAVKH